MHVDVERRPGCQVALTVTVEPAVIEEQMERLFQKVARRVKIPGFRPGKAPRQLIEAQIDRGALMRDAVEDVIEATYKDALREQQIEPLEQGEIEDVKTSEDMTLTYRVIVSARPQVELPEYTSLEVNYTATQVTDEQVDAEIARLRERTSEMNEVPDAPIEQGDLVTIDYMMTVNGEPYPEGEVSGYPLEIGSDTFFPELNEGLLGAKEGETVTINKTFPEDYSNKDLAGKSAEYAVTVQQVRRTVAPETTDEWVKAITNGTIETMDELRDRIRENLKELAARMDRDNIREELVRQVVSKSTLEVPNTMVDEEYSRLMDELESRLARQHMTMEDYAELYNRSVADIENEQTILARDFVRRSLVLQEVARREKIYVTDEDLEALMIMDSYQQGEHDMEKIRKQLKNKRKEMEKSGRLDQLAGRLFQEKILSFLEKAANVKVDGQPLASLEPAPAESEDTSADSQEENAE